jgi:hypothetical protein
MHYMNVWQLESDLTLLNRVYVQNERTHKISLFTGISDMPVGIRNAYAKLCAKYAHYRNQAETEWARIAGADIDLNLYPLSMGRIQPIVLG